MLVRCICPLPVSCRELCPSASFSQNCGLRLLLCQFNVYVEFADLLTAAVTSTASNPASNLGSFSASNLPSSAFSSAVSQLAARVSRSPNAFFEVPNVSTANNTSNPSYTSGGHGGIYGSAPTLVMGAGGGTVEPTFLISLSYDNSSAISNNKMALSKKLA